MSLAPPTSVSRHHLTAFDHHLNPDFLTCTAAQLLSSAVDTTSSFLSLRWAWAFFSTLPSAPVACNYLRPASRAPLFHPPWPSLHNLASLSWRLCSLGILRSCFILIPPYDQSVLSLYRRLATSSSTSSFNVDHGGSTADDPETLRRASLSPGQGSCRVVSGR